MGGLAIRALLFGVHIRASDSVEAPKIGKRLPKSSPHAVRVDGAQCCTGPDPGNWRLGRRGGLPKVCKMMMAFWAPFKALGHPAHGVETIPVRLASCFVDCGPSCTHCHTQTTKSVLSGSCKSHEEYMQKGWLWSRYIPQSIIATPITESEASNTPDLGT